MRDLLFVLACCGVAAVGDASCLKTKVTKEHRDAIKDILRELLLVSSDIYNMYRNHGKNFYVDKTSEEVRSLGSFPHSFFSVCVLSLCMFLISLLNQHIF